MTRVLPRVLLLSRSQTNRAQVRLLKVSFRRVQARLRVISVILSKIITKYDFICTRKLILEDFVLLSDPATTMGLIPG